MSHELYGNNHMVYVGETPWHGLGTRVDRIDTLPAVLDWRIVKRPVLIEGLKENRRAERYAGLVRSSDGKIMSIVGADYEPHQNAELWQDVFQPFVDAGELVADTAGMLQDGNRIWLLARIPGASFDVGTTGKRDVSNGYMLLATSHDSSLATCALATSVRVVCQNTLTLATSGTAKGFSQRHTSTLRADDARGYVRAAVESFTKHHAQAERLKATPVEPLVLLTYAAELVQPALFEAVSGHDDKYTGKTVEQILASTASARAFEHAYHKSGARLTKALVAAVPTQDGGFDGTAWGLANAVSYYTDHVRGRTTDTRLNSAWFGDSARLKRDAFALADTYADRLAA